MLDKGLGIEQELRKWQAERARRDDSGPSPIVRDRRTVRVNGREIEIVKKPRRASA